jgi:hypothetical protein
MRQVLKLRQRMDERQDRWHIIASRRSNGKTSRLRHDTILIARFGFGESEASRLATSVVLS